MPWFSEVLSELRTWAAPIVAFIIALLLLRLKNRLLRSLEEKGHMRASMAGRFRVLGRWVVLFGLFLVVLNYLGLFDNVWAVATTALAAVAVGVVAIWSILSNVLAAVLILVYRPFRIGDEIEILEITTPTGVRGRVVDMNLMFTVLQQVDKERGEIMLAHLPNNLVFQKIVRLCTVRESAAPFFAGKISERPEALEE